MVTIEVMSTKSQYSNLARLSAVFLYIPSQQALVYLRQHHMHPQCHLLEPHHVSRASGVTRDAKPTAVALSLLPPVGHIP